MIPSEGLIGSFGGQMLLILIALGIGMVGCVAFMVVVFVRKAPPLTTQTDRVTGVTEHGIGAWMFRVSLFTVAPPLVFGIVWTLIAAVDWLNVNLPLWWFVAGPVCVGALGACVVLWREERRKLRTRQRVGQTPLEPQPVPVPKMWELDPETPQWDARP